MIRKKQNILIISPHGDDEILGCGGTINKLSSTGNAVYVLVITNPHKGNPKLYSEMFLKKIRKETVTANKFLGVKDVFFFDFPVNNLNKIDYSLIIDSIKKIIIKIRPNKIYIPHGNDIHNDHKIVNHCSLVASRPINNMHLVNILEYETLSETEWSENYKFAPNYFNVLSKKNLEAKINSMKKYRSQLKKNPHPRSIDVIKSLAHLRGSSIGNDYAEAFILKRYIDI